MNINSYGAHNTPINYANSKHSKPSSNSSNATFGQMPQETHVPSGNITIHGIYGNTDEAGNKIIGGWGDAIAGTSSTIYKPADFDPANPEYLMKIWDSNNELLEERRVNIGDVNTRSSDAFDMYAYSCHLSDSGEFPPAMDRFMMISAGNKSGRLEYSISDMLKKTDWVGVLKSFMDTQYKLGNMKGYMDYKSFYDFLGAQKSTSINSTTPQVIDGVVYENRSNAQSLSHEEALEEKDLWLLLHEHIDEMREKLKNGEVQYTIPIGAQTFTIEEWDELMEKFDKIEEQIAEAMREEIEKRKAIQEAEKGNLITQDDAVNIIVTDSLKCKYEQINPDKEEPLYITAFDSTGIRCVKEGSESFEWIIEFKNEEDYAKVAEFVNNLPEFSGYRFAPNRNFWEDFLSGKIDTSDFKKFLNGTDDGKPDYLIQTEDGTYIDREKAKYAQYMNNPGFFTVLTLDEVNQRLREGYYSGSDDDEDLSSAGSKSDSYAALHIADAVSRGVNPLDELRKSPKAPYEHLATGGVINYKGATFILDTENNSINLGDVSIEAKKAGKVISVPLEGGGTFNFNVDNMEQLGKAIDMFSPEDINRILRAIHEYKMAQSKKKELDDIKDGVIAL